MVQSIFCEKCKIKISEVFPRKCAYCHKFHCQNHQSLESHNCPTLKGGHWARPEPLPNDQEPPENFPTPEPLPVKITILKEHKLGSFVLIALILFGILFWQIYTILTPDRGEIIFKQANEKCSVYVESFCPTKSVKVEGETFDCLWNRQEQKCTVWWKK